MVSPVISEVARQAIARGVERGDSITDLELLGLPYRIICMLEESTYHITTLEKLVSLTREELSGIRQIGEQSFFSILDSLSRYHQLDQIREMQECLLRREAESIKERSQSSRRWRQQ
jgi:hypothetical protein